MTRIARQVRGSSPAAPHVGRAPATLARKCDCGNHASGGTCDACAEKKKRKLSRFAERPAQSGDAAPPIVHDVLRGGGEQLPDNVRAVMEPRFGADFSDVRLHTDETAAQSARAVSAHAYTAGSHIAFASGRYQPSTGEGQRLLAHELTHVVQQRGSGGAGSGQGAGALTIGDPADASEREADTTADRVLGAQPHAAAGAPRIGAGGAGLQRDLSDGAIGGIVAAGIAGSVAAGFLIAWGAGAFDKEHFTTDELIAYLDELAETHAPKKKTISDNMARDVVRHWLSGKDPKIDVSKGHQGKQKSLTSIELRRLLIQEMLAGPTTAADEDQIIAIVENTTPDDLIEVFDPTKGLAVQDVNADVDGDKNARLMQVLDSKFPASSRVRDQQTSGSMCNARDALMIFHAKNRALEMVDHTVRMLATPEDPSVQAALDCYFRGASAKGVSQLKATFERIQQLLPSALYFCSRGMATGSYKLPGGTQQAECITEDADALMMAPTEKDPRILEAGRGVFLCDKFFERPGETQATTVIHENAHRAGADDLKYLPSCGYALDQAANNADSYSQFARAVFEGRGSAAATAPPNAANPVKVKESTK